MLFYVRNFVDDLVEPSSNAYILGGKHDDAVIIPIIVDRAAKCRPWKTVGVEQALFFRKLDARATNLMGFDVDVLRLNHERATAPLGVNDWMRLEEVQMNLGPIGESWGGRSHSRCEDGQGRHGCEKALHLFSAFAHA